MPEAWPGRRKELRRPHGPAHQSGDRLTLWIDVHRLKHVAELDLVRCMRVTIHEAMSETYIKEVAAAVSKVARHYAKA